MLPSAVNIRRNRGEEKKFCAENPHQSKYGTPKKRQRGNGNQLYVYVRDGGGGKSKDLSQSKVMESKRSDNSTTL